MRIPIAITLAVTLLALPVAHEMTVDRSSVDRDFLGQDAAAELISAVTAHIPAVTAHIPALTAHIPAVTAHIPAVGGAARVDVQQRSTADWGFGSAVRATSGQAHAYPRGWLFIAHREAGQWRVALQGEPAFAALGARAPILTTAERDVLAGTPLLRNGGQGGGGSTQYGDRRTAIGLPYAQGTAWTLASGPHSMSGDGPRSSLDLTGGDGVVRAAADGIAYTMCGGRGWIRVLHARGYATDYYHLRDNIDVDGQLVRAGDFLGYIGNDVSCGGYSSGAHVHFSLLQGGEYLDIDRYSLGQWTISAGATPREGVLRHGSRVVGVGDYVYNYGPQALDEGVVDTGGRGFLPRHSGPGDSYPVIGQIPDGAAVSVLCSVRGSANWGRSAAYGTTLWNRLGDGGYVSDAFLTTGTSGPVRGYCP
jgi:LasA protease